MMTTAATNHGLRALAWLSVGVLVAGAFAIAILPPLRVTVVALAMLSAIGIASLRVANLSMMSRLFVLLYSLPFSASLGYLFDPGFIWARGVNSAPLCQIPDLINGMLTMATVGLCGLMAGIEGAAGYMRRFRPAIPVAVPGTADVPTLPLPVTVLLLLVSIALSWLHAPAKSIFEAAYTGNVETELKGAYLISYLILILLYVDFERDLHGSLRRRLKLAGLSATVAYIVIVLQFLRGDRECSGLVAALAMLCITSPAADAPEAGIGWFSGRMKRALLLAVPLAVCVVAFAALGTLRRSVTEPTRYDPDTRSLAVKYFTRNTWTAVSLNNLGLATDYHYDNVEYLHGRTYWDYVLSLPPSPAAKWFGYVRPMDGPANPSLWYECLMALGGMHPVVVPFRNFGIWGVLPLLFLSGAFICCCETLNERGTLSARLLYGCVATSSMAWFWYGDMNLIRALMMWAILLLLYRPGWFRVQRATVPTCRTVS